MNSLSWFLRGLRGKLIEVDANVYTRLRASADARLATRATAQGERPKPAHLLTGERGEDAAFFHLRAGGYTVVARRWRSERVRGDLDLVAWDGDTLVVFEVKTRTVRDLAPAETAVDRDKQIQLRRLARAWLRQLPEPFRDRVLLRFDVLAVYLLAKGTEFEHFRSAFSVTSAPPASRFGGGAWR